MNELPTALGELTRLEVEDAIENGSVLFVPTGSIEQHGPHLPLGTDSIIASWFAKEAAEKIGGLVAPVFDHGAFSRTKSGGGRSFNASLGVPPEAFAITLKGFLRESIRQGFNRIVIVNGHFENADPAFNALEELLGPLGEVSPANSTSDSVSQTTALLISWWEVLTDDDVYGVFGDDFPGWPAEHAGVLETSLMEYIEPRLVHSDRKVEGGGARTIGYERFPCTPDTVWPTGIGSTALPTSADLGRQVADLVVSKIATAIQDDL